MLRTAAQSISVQRLLINRATASLSSLKQCLIYATVEALQLLRCVSTALKEATKAISKWAGKSRDASSNILAATRSYLKSICCHVVAVFMPPFISCQCTIVEAF